MRNFVIGILVGASFGIGVMSTKEVTVVETEYVPVDVVREVEVLVEIENGYTPREVDLLAATMWGEARSDGIDGMLAVGHVILNRVNSPNDRRFGATLEQVILKPYQFSAWNQGDPNRSRMLSLIDGNTGIRDYDYWLIARELARQILSGNTEDPTNGSLYYHTHNVSPTWANYGENPLTLASHVFYTDATQ